MKVDFELNNLKIGWKMGLVHSINQQRSENGSESDHYYHIKY